METTAIILQVVNGESGWTIDPGWVIAGLMAVVGFLLVRILNRFERKLEHHDTRLGDHEVRIKVMEKAEHHS